MPLPSPQIIGWFFFGSELLLGLAKRSKDSQGAGDQGSLRVLWIVIILSINAAIAVSYLCRGFRLPHAVYLYGFWLFVIGLLLRWAAILRLGRFFTVNVAIQESHQVVNTGLYRFVRHPSYTGSLLEFLGLGLCLLNGLSVVVLLVPITMAYLHRIRIEEAALTEYFGDTYRAYAARTKRLIPLIY